MPINKPTKPKNIKTFITISKKFIFDYFYVLLQ